MTHSSTFTITDARYIASKLGADLRNLNARYGAPAVSSIENFVEETAQYLKAGYLDSVDFGFKDGQRWMLRLRYTALAGGQLRDNPPGGLPRAVEIADYQFHSFLTPNNTFLALPSAERAAFTDSLPVRRTAGSEPTTTTGTYEDGFQYSRNGTGLSRDVYRAI